MKYLVMGVGLIVGVMGVIWWKDDVSLKLIDNEKHHEEEGFHIHADLKLYINGQAVYLSDDKYQSTPEHSLDGETHLHDNQGGVIHVHAEGVTLQYFLSTLGIGLTDACIQVTDNDEEYCMDESQTLTLLVNGKQENLTEPYLIKDLDRILVSYGSTDELEAQYASVSDDACIYSETCPERGKPPTEQCVGGLGSSCGI